MVDCHHSECIVNLGFPLVDNVFSVWQSTMSTRKEYYIYYITIYTFLFVLEMEHSVAYGL